MPIDVVNLINTYGIALILIKTRDDREKDAIAEVVSEDSLTITVRNIGVITGKPHFDEIVLPDGSINPMFTVPDGYTDLRTDIILLDKTGQTLTVKKTDLLSYEDVRDNILITQYLRSKAGG